MKKILLIGELGNATKSLNESLARDFQVQLCPDKPDNVQPMLKVVKPDMLMFCQIDAGQAAQSILDWAVDNCRNLPILVITTGDIWSKYSKEEWNGVVNTMFRPVLKSDLIAKCRELLGVKKAEDGAVCPGTSDNQIKKKIMIVDDSPIMLRTMKDMLDSQFDVRLAKSGEQALALIADEKPDMILLDYEMDGMDGRETFEAMKADDSMADIPVVFLTSVTDKKAIYSVMKSKPDGYVLKPPDRQKILNIIQEVFIRRNSQE